MKQKNIVGKRVCEARKKTKPPVTQKDLVARLEIQGLHINQSVISKIEQGQRPVTDVEIVAMAKALKVDAGWLLGDNTKPTK